MNQKNNKFPQIKTFNSIRSKLCQKKNAFYAQSGGVTAVINATACGVIETARKHKESEKFMQDEMASLAH